MRIHYKTKQFNGHLTFELNLSISLSLLHQMAFKKTTTPMFIKTVISAVRGNPSPEVAEAGGDGGGEVGGQDIAGDVSEER